MYACIHIFVLTLRSRWWDAHHTQLSRGMNLSRKRESSRHRGEDTWKRLIGSEYSRKLVPFFARTQRYELTARRTVICHIQGYKVLLEASRLLLTLLRWSCVSTMSLYNVRIMRSRVSEPFALVADIKPDPSREPCHGYVEHARHPSRPKTCIHLSYAWMSWNLRKHRSSYILLFLWEFYFLTTSKISFRRNRVPCI